MTAIELRFCDEELVCDYGIVGIPHTGYHGYKDSGKRNPPLCFHAIKPLPSVVLFGTDAILDIGPLPYLHTNAWPCILYRKADLVTMAFDRKGPINGQHRRPSERFKPALVYHYRLMPVRWWDEDTSTTNMLLGLRIDEETS